MKYALLALLLMLPPALHAQHADPRIRAASEAEFLSKAKAAAAAYVVQEDALLDGYRPIGPELPAMGQHWLNPEFANLGYIDPARPGFLLYATVDGQPKLAGLGYTIALKPGEQLPELPAGRAAWHEHSGNVADEAFAVTHQTVDDERRFRVVALHIWHVVPAPDGTYSPENWSLPFLRNGVPIAGTVDHKAARMLALTHGGDAYYAEVIARYAGLADADKARVRSILGAYALDVAKRVDLMRAGSSGMVESAHFYDAMWADLDEQLPTARPRIQELRELWSHGGH